MQNRSVRRGFTLLEILLVIATIGILASIVLVAINPTRQIAQLRNAERRVEINSIQQAIEQYFANTRSYPTGITAAMQNICINGNTVNCLNLATLVPDYIPEIPIDPQGEAYTVGINTTNNRLRISAGQAELGEIIAINLCPTGYIVVPGNSIYGTKDFCVMKYEAKAVAISSPTVGLTSPNTVSSGVNIDTIDNNTTATTAANNRTIASVASGYPIGNISQLTAKSYCTTAGASLIKNSEWMTIARNIERQASNWRNGIIGSADSSGGGLWRGHTDSTPLKALVASTDDSQGYTGTENTSPSRERRTYTLSNGEVIWDLSGNIWEWTDDTILNEDQPKAVSSPAFAQREYTAIDNYGTLSYDLISPSNNTWNSSHNMGKISSGTLSIERTWAFLRGGWTYGNGAGIYSLFLGNTTLDIWGLFGFRCVVR
jgi:prepilin-type N-terminal cleavage/methylation domain-containing protein